MTQILILGSGILAQGPFTDTGDSLAAPDIVYPKATIPGYQIVDVPLPDHFSPAGFTWNGSEIVAKTAPLSPIPIPQTVSRLQALCALQKAGLLSQVQAAVTASPDPLSAIVWNNAATFERASPTLQALATAAGLTAAQLDSLFIAAAQIVV